MTRACLTRRLGVLGILVLCSAVLVPSLSADPIIVTSGRFEIPDDDATFFEFFGADEFLLKGLFVPTLISPHLTCLSGCVPGSELNMSTVAGREVPFAPSPFLGSATAAIVNGTVFKDPLDHRTLSPHLVGTLRFDAPVVVLPPSEVLGLNLIAPFVFSGDVTGFAREDVEGRMPLFHVRLAGQGTANLNLHNFGGLFMEPTTTYTFATAAPVPEPTALLLLGTGLAGIGVRWRLRKQH